MHVACTCAQLRVTDTGNHILRLNTLALPGRQTNPFVTGQSDGSFYMEMLANPLSSKRTSMEPHDFTGYSEMTNQDPGYMELTILHIRFHP
jgi:hypothetical protein